MKTTLHLIILFFTTTLFAQPTCQWAYIPVGASQSYNHIYNSIVDHSGNTIELGMILGSADMDPGSNPADTAFTDFSYNYYFSKTSPSGNLIWIHYFENNSQFASLEYAGLKINSANEIIVAGNYMGMIDFDLSDSGVDTLRSHFATYPDYFVAKYDSAGDYKWAFSIGDPTTNDIQAQAITVLSNDNIVVAANPNGGTIDVDPGSGVHNSIGGNGNLICYDTNGNYVWNNNISTTYSYCVLNNSLDADGAGNTCLGTVGYYELTLNKFDISGARINSITLGDFSNQARVDPQSILTDKSTGDIYVAGTFGGTVDFNPSGAAVNKSSSSGFYQDGFIAKYDQNLNLLWVNAYEGEVVFGDYCLDFDSVDIIAGGSIAGTIDFGNGNVFTSPTTFSPFYIKLNSTGITQSGFSLDGFGQYNSLHTGINNSFVATGNIVSSMDLDPTAASLVLVPASSTAFTAFYQSPTQTFVSENNNQDNIVAYPNPTNDKLVLKIKSNSIGKNYIIFDVTGREIMTNKLIDETTTIDLSFLSAGIYTLILGTNKEESIKIIRQ